MTTVDLTQYDPLAAAVQADPYPYYGTLRRDAPVHFVDAIGAYAVSRHADVKRVMHDHATFSSAAMATLVGRPVRYSADAQEVDVEEDSGVSIIGTDGDKHARLRMIVNRGFTPRRTAEMEDDMRRIARSIARPLIESGTSDLQAGLAIPFPTSVIASLLGVDPDRRDEFRRWSELMVFAVFEPTDDEQRAEVARASDEMTVWLDETIAARDGAGGDDLISVLLRAEAEGGALTHNELGVFIITLLVAGSITTAYLIGAAAVALAHDARLQAEARRYPGVVAAVVEETLRYETPTQMMFRLTTTDVEIAGNMIPSGATVAALLGSANRDERVFPDADRFDATRNTTEQLAFGHGAHFCLGAALARLEARIAIEELLACAPRLELTAEVQPVRSLVFRGPKYAPFAYR